MTEPDHPDGLSVDRLFFVLQDDRRRRVLDALRDRDSIELSDLADEVTLPDEDRKTVYISLTQTHIDVLSEAGVIEWRPIASLVCPGPNYTAAKSVVSYAEDAATRTVDPSETG